MSKILVIGDVIVDRYVRGKSNRLSPEAPVPIVEHQFTTEAAGGAGLVHKNLKSLKLDVELYDTKQPSSLKTRVICDGHYVTRIDEDVEANSKEVLDLVLSDTFDSYDYVILSDYNKGVLKYSKQIIQHINSFGCKVIVDPKKSAEEYQGAWLVKPNDREFELFGFSEWQGNIVTTNADRQVIAHIEGKEYRVPVETVEVADVTGAGDCFLAALVYGLVKGYKHEKSLDIAVRGSRKSVSQNGTYSLTIQDLEQKTVFTNGVFDILHKGHFELLKQARELGSELIVAINSDASAKRLKGTDRPVNNETARREQLEMLPWVDRVLVFDDDTPYKDICSIRPDLIVKGGDYSVNEVVGSDVAEVYIVPRIDGYSTTNIIETGNENSSNRS
jgi:D-beta-D-heptose 7-phosphate kinase/D-beta-D-heptose 1-phosphate adenosyltransferase